ncbi:MAG: AAA family ATPase [Magnetococcales bacterium]|nr:AAA family ATPase [Magnetococcales bacterium]
MYENFFGLKQIPFSITPNPRFLFPSHRHKEALAHLFYSFQGNNGFVLLTGEVGTGKTTLSRCLLEQTPGFVDTALIFNPKLSAHELIASICDELKIAYPPETTSIKQLYDALNHHLIRAHIEGRTTVLIIDEAQNLTIELLEQIRLLTNLENSLRKLLTIILIGQPELNKLLERPELRQLAQRITARYHITPLTAYETIQYIQYRLVQAGATQPVFTESAMRLIHRCSRGVPRIINKICDRAMLGAYSLGKHLIDRRIIRRSAKELGHLPAFPVIEPLLAGGVLIGSVLVLLLFLPHPITMPWSKSGDPIANAYRIANLWFQTTLSRQPIAVSSKQIQQGMQPAATSSSPSTTSTTSTTSTVPVMDAGRDALFVNNNLEKLFLDVNNPATLENAFSAMLALWDVKNLAKKSVNECKQLVSHGLSCLFLYGNWQQMQLLNAPAIVGLVDAVPPRYAVISALTPHGITFEFPGQRYTLPLTQLDRSRLVPFLVFWKFESQQGKILQEGVIKESVIALRKQLERIQGETIPSEYPELFDGVLKLALQKFQIKTYLHPDGVLGPMTAITLDAMDRSANKTAPRLH